MNEKFRYELIVYWSVDDDAYIVEVPTLAGCKADGNTYEEAIKNVQVIISEWIETAIEEGREIPSPERRFVFAK